MDAAKFRERGVPLGRVSKRLGKRGMWVLLASAALVVVLGFACAMTLFSARSALLAGTRQLSRAEEQLRSTNSGLAPVHAFDLVRSDVLRANKDFHSANRRLSLVAPVLHLLGWLPSIGPSLASAPQAALAADQTTAGLVPLLQGLRPLAGVVGGARSGHTAIETLTLQLAAGRPDFVRSCALLHQAQETRAKIGPRPYIASFGAALHSLDDRLPRLVILCRTLLLSSEFLGVSHPATYLIAYLDSHELRATGGFIGSADLLTLRRGRVSLRFQGSGTRDNASIKPPDPVQLYNRESGWLFRDSNWSPDFPTSAALERFFFKLDFHQSAEGVVNLNPVAVANLLIATGPVYAAPYHRWVTGGNVNALADYYAHWSPAAHVVHLRDTQRKQFIGIVAAAVLQKVNKLTIGQWFRLGASIASSLARRDILINFKQADQQALLRSAGADGAMSDTSSDFLYVVDTNLSYNKINSYVHLQTTYNVRVRRDRWLVTNLTLQLTNSGPPRRYLNQGLGPGAGRLGTPLDYATFLRIYVPAGAQLLSEDGWTQAWEQRPAYGRTMFSGYKIVRAGRTSSISLEYVVPPNIFSWSAGRRYRIVIPHQPGSRRGTMRVNVSVDGEPTRGWVVSQPDQDWSRNITIQQVPFRAIPLSHQPPTVVAPGYWVEPYAYLGVPNSKGPFVTPQS